MSSVLRCARAVAAHVALIGVVAFLGAIVAGFGKVHPTAGSVDALQLRFEVGETMPIAVDRSGRVPIAELAPAPATRCPP